MQITIEIPDAIAQRLQTHWSNLTQKVLELTVQTAQQTELVNEAETEAILRQTQKVEADPEVLRYMEQQAALYKSQQNQLLGTYLGQYILFEDGKVLDADLDFETLILRIFAETGPRDVFIRQVGVEPTRPIGRTPFPIRSS